MSHFRRLSALLLIPLLGVGLLMAGLLPSSASSHREAPLISEDPVADDTDVYAFVSPDKPDTVTIIGNWIPLEEPAGGPNFYKFGQDVRYQFKIDNNADGVEDKVIQVTFHGTGAAQTVEVRGPIAPAVAGAMDNRIAQVAASVTGKVNTVLGSAGGMQVFAGPRDDPFFIDLEQFFRILPDRKPVSGALGALPDTATASSFRAAGSAVDFVAGYNVLSIIVELPTSAVTAGGTAKIGVWGTISR